MLPEKRLIQAQLRFFCQPDREDEVTKGLSERVNWGRYLDICNAQGLEGVAYYVFRKLGCTDSLPGEVAAYLRWKYYQTAARNIYLLDQLRQVVSAFEKAHLSLLPIQGASLVETLYPSLGTRPMNDIDLLVKKEEWPEARRILQGLGYSPLPWFPNFFSCNGTVIDIHFDLTGADRIRSRKYAVRIQMERVWAEAVSAAGSSGRMSLSPVDTVLYLASHLQKHSFSRLIWFLDLALFFHRHRDINLSELWNRGREFNLTKPLYFVLCYLDSVFNIKFPGKIESKFNTSSLNLAERRFLHALLAGEEMGLVGDLLLAFSIPNLSARFRLLAETAFPRRQIMAQIYPWQGLGTSLWVYPHRSLNVLVNAVKLLFWLLRP